MCFYAKGFKMPARIVFQSPATDAESYLESVLSIVSKAEAGGGVFSFASPQGIRLLIQDPVFLKFLERGHFHLVVGVDAVTSPKSLELLTSLARDHAQLSCEAFYNSSQGALFHPKWCWFRNGDVARCLVGSGNLTEGGLVKNWEAFSIFEDKAGAIQKTWDDWLSMNASFRRSTDDKAVIERAALNKPVPRPRIHEEYVVEEADEKAVEESASGESKILLAEIPKAAGRWNQANFSLEVFKDFFQLAPGTYHRVILTPISDKGNAGQKEVRQSVSVKSQNYRVELGLAAGKSYPANGRPIGVFLRTGTRRFRYRLLMPSNKEHRKVSKYLSKLSSASASRMKREIVNYEDFAKELPGFSI